jgi:SAM-dependent methyltransferase
MTAPACQACAAPLVRSLVDLGLQPLANALVRPERAAEPDPVYPLHARICEACLLVQVEPAVPPEAIFSDYPYFSSFSPSWLAHCEAFAAEMTEQMALDAKSRVVEIGSNDGALLSRFAARGIPALGVEPARNVAEAAIARGLATEIAYFGAETGRRLAAEGGAADLIAATNVLAHVPDIDDFVAGIRALLKPGGRFVVEFPHLLNLIREVQFDTIYHEHFTYLSLLALRPIFARHGLHMIDVARQPTHGGSLRLFVGRDGSPGAAVDALVGEEIAAGLDRPEGYDGFQDRVAAVRDGLLRFLAEARAGGRTVVAYGAAAKGNTLLNHAGVGLDDIAFVVDRNPAKQGRLLPGSRLPIHPVEALIAAQPDYVLILPWNLREEVIAQLPEVAAWGGRFVTAIPEIRIFDAD